MMTMMINESAGRRYTSIDLPAYKYIPQKGLHPSKRKDIVHIPEISDDLADFSALNWSNSTKYLYAIDLFNLGYYWEVHEVLEKLWIRLGKKSEEGTFIQGLIQLAVALLKYSQKNLEGAERLINKSLPKIQSQQRIYLGIDIKKLSSDAVDYVSGRTNATPQIMLKPD